MDNSFGAAVAEGVLATVVMTAVSYMGVAPLPKLWHDGHHGTIDAHQVNASGQKEG